MLSYTVATRALATPMGSLVGFADLILGDVVQVKGFKIRKADNGDIYVQAPAEAGKKPGPDGKTPYYDTVRFLDPRESEDDKQTPFQREVYAEIVKAFKAGGSSTGAARPQQAEADSKPAKQKRNPLAW